MITIITNKNRCVGLATGCRAPPRAIIINIINIILIIINNINNQCMIRTTTIIMTKTKTDAWVPPLVIAPDLVQVNRHLRALGP